MNEITPAFPPAAPTLAAAMILSASTPLLLLDASLDIVSASGTFCRAFAVDPALITGRSIFALGAGEWDTPRLRSLLGAIVSGGAEVDAYEFELVRPEATRCLVVNAHKLDYDDQAGVRLLLSVTDVTDLREHDRRMDELVREKATLLQELQHRVANSLQIIASVLMQSARNTQSAESRSHLNDAHHRVMSIAAVQRQLATTGAGQVALRAYLGQLCQSIGASMIHDHDRVSLDTRIDDSSVTPETSVSLGLIVTELVINALKHAFPDQRDGRIMVGYRRVDGGWILSVSDNGVGMPAADRTAVVGLGTTIVQALARKLNAGITVSDSRPGTYVAISRPPLQQDGTPFSVPEPLVAAI